MKKNILFILVIFTSCGVVQAQNVGIGTLTPTEKLHVAGSARITALGGVGNALVLTNNNGVLSRTALSGNGTDVLDGTGTFVPIASLNDDDWTVAGATMYNNNTGNVGIGTTTPVAKLEVAGGRVEFSATTDASPTAGSGVLEIGNSLRLDGNEIITNTGSTLYLQNDNNGDLRVDGTTLVVDASANRVGIGTSTPTAELTVGGWIGRTAHNNGALAGSYNNVGANSAQSNPIYVIGTSYKPNAATLGNMYGIGYTNTNGSFINGAGSWGMYVAADGDARIWLGASNGGESYFNTGGFFGLNTNTPTRTLDVNGTVRIRGGAPNAGDLLMAQNTNGDATWSNAGYGMVPIGSIVAWHKNAGGIPGLPAGWVECNGGTSNGITVPNLNANTTSKSGDASYGRFLRGRTTSGLFQTDQSNNLRWINHDDSGSGTVSTYLDDDGTTVTIRNYSTSGDRFQTHIEGVETRVSNMAVVWIMRTS
jgi:hypothetical protein